MDCACKTRGSGVRTAHKQETPLTATWTLALLRDPD